MSESLKDMATLSCLVFGGGNGWGKCIAETLKAHGAAVCIIEKDQSLDVVQAAIKASTLVFIAIPDAAISSLLHTYSELLKTKIILDCATNKTGFQAELQQLASLGASVCSTHPMAASTGTLRGQNALIMPIGDNAAEAERHACAIYAALGMNCRRLDFCKHTELMTAVQMLPHIVQRLSIDVLGQALQKLDIRIGELADLATANYLLAELGLGRVAAQRPEVSAGIIETAWQDNFGRELMDNLRQSLQHIQHAANSRAELQTQFSASTQCLDPDGTWRADMALQSEAALIRLGNLRSQSLTIEAPNRVGMLRDILTVLAKYGIDMTALDSRLVANADGSERVYFDIAISNEQAPHTAIAKELAAIEAHFIG